jgi:hypothetical protein
MQERTYINRDDIPASDRTANWCVDWSAIIAGALTAAVVSLILLLLGTGFGLAAVSPWSQEGISVTAFTVTTAIWLIVMQWIASGLGGYLTGRLRKKWHGMHGDEVYFRDTAQGFMAWVVATLFTALFLASATTSLISGGVKSATAISAGAAAGAANGAADASASTAKKPADDNGYFIDTLLRPDHVNPSKQAPEPELRGEVTRIILNDVKNGEFSEEDKNYLAQIVAARAGLSQDEAAKRVDDTISQIKDAENKLKQKADEARKIASTAAIFTFLSLLIGAFIASVAAALGGKRRDTY